MSLSARKKLAHYEVMELIGKGRMGEVYRAREPASITSISARGLRAGIPRSSDSSPMQTYAVAPDGRFLMIDVVDTEQAPSQLAVVLDWFQDSNGSSQPNN